MVKVKICGITNLDDALASMKAGCDALGFAFFKKSPRYIPPRLASEIVKNLPARIVKIGVFVNAKEKTIKYTARLCHLDMLQFHGNESPEFCDKFKGYRVIKAFRVKEKIDIKKISRYRTFAYLFDAFTKERFGGTGTTFDWKLARNLKGLRRPVFLAGGLNAGNVRKAIRLVRPEWVDACSCVESQPGIKDHLKVKRFIKQAKGQQ